MAIWKKCRYDRKSSISTFGGGIDRSKGPFHVPETKVFNNSGVDSDRYPAVQTAKGTTLFYNPAGTVYGLGQRDDAILHVVQGPMWEYWNSATTAFTTVSSSISSGYGSLSELATESVLYTLFVSTAEHLSWDGTTAVPVSMSSDCPLSPLITSHKGRVYMAKDKTVYYSALLKTTDWATAEDAGNIPITNARGDITGIKEYADRIIIFTQNSMHELYGDNAKNFSLVDVSNEIGCIRYKTIKEVGGRLYWLDYSGAFQYGGCSYPEKISEPIKDIVDHPPSTWLSGSACAGTYRNKYYLSIPSGSTAANEIELIYDPSYAIWNRDKKSCRNMEDYVSFEDRFFSVDENNDVFERIKGELTLNSSSIMWNVQTGFYNDGTLGENKTLHSIDITYRIESSNAPNTKLELYYTTTLVDSPDPCDFPDYDLLAATTSSTKLVAGIHTLPLTTGLNASKMMIPTTAMQNLGCYNFLIKGWYHATIYGLQRNLRIKRDTF